MRVDKMNDQELDQWCRKQYEMNPEMPFGDLIRLAFRVGYDQARADALAEKANAKTPLYVVEASNVKKGTQ